MAIEKIKQELSQGGMKERPEKMPSPPAKEEKKDASIFGGKTGMEKGTFDYKLRDPEMYRGTELGSSRISELGKKLFGGGGYIKKSNLERANQQLDLGKWGEYKGFSEKDKQDSKKLIKKLLGESGK